MSFRIVQRGRSPVVVGFLVGQHMDAELRAALPGQAIVMTAEAPTPTLAELEAARSLVGPKGGSCLLVGYSLGCSSVRSLLRAGASGVVGVVTIDGTHASWPPLSWQIDVWKAIAEEARMGWRIWVATCTQQTYTEQLDKRRDGHDPFMSTVHVLEAVLDLPLPPGLEVHEGELHVISFDSARMDGEAHKRQQQIVLPAMLREYVAPFLDTEEPTDPTLPAPMSWRDPSVPLGERACILALREMQEGVREEPPGSNTSARIREYLAPAHRGGKLLNLEAAEWCAAFACWCALTSARGYDGDPSEVLPHPYAVSGVEIEDAAKRNGSWWPAASGYLPRRGDLAIYKRGSQTWQRHVARVLDAPRDGLPDFTTIGGNEEHTIRITRRRMGDATLLGFVEYPTTITAPARDVA